MDIKNIKRFNPSSDFGLSYEQVKERENNMLLNIDKSIASKSILSIIKDNLFNLFNFINLVLAIAILYTGSYRNLMFMGVVICNAVIGIFQEIKAKRTIDKLNLISSSNTEVIRNGEKQKIRLEKIVLDDIICLKRGTQIVTDCIVVDGKCEVNESLLTGEPDLIPKSKADMLLSGSYVVSGSCRAKVEHIGENNYASELLKGSKFIKKTKSEIMKAINKIISIISIAIIPMGALLFYRQYISSGNNLNLSIVTTSAALTGMIPEGLVLLTSSVLAVGVLKLSKKKVLVQDIYSLETLARVDTICLDKTGTITQGTFEYHDTVPYDNFQKSDLENALTNIVSTLNDNNETFMAISDKFKPIKNIKANIVIPFSSEKKWSGVYIENYGSLILGAAEFIFKDKYTSNIKEKIKQFSNDYRILCLAKSENKFLKKSNGYDLPEDIKLMGFILIKDKIRNSAKKVLAFFKKQAVDIKVISGDDPLTVSSIAKRVNLENADKFINARELNTPEKIKDSVSKYTIFGRVTPNQKQEIIKALKNEGRTVAMVGDGVNDVLAMKESDCSVAMASGSDIAKNVSHLVLLNSDFSAMPRTVAEGRKAINNIQRSSSLFLVKTIYSFLLSILFFIIPAPYPFIPIQMTLISALTIGIPSFILALEPNREKIKSNLFKNIVSKSFPAAISIVFAILLSVSVYFIFDISYELYSTINVILAGVLGIMLIYKISIPLNFLRKSLIWFVSLSFVYSIFKFPDILEIEQITFINFLIISSLLILSVAFYDFVSKIDFKELFNKEKIKV